MTGVENEEKILIKNCEEIKRRLKMEILLFFLHMKENSEKL